MIVLVMKRQTKIQHPSEQFEHLIEKSLKTEVKYISLTHMYMTTPGLIQALQ